MEGDTMSAQHVRELRAAFYRLLDSAERLADACRFTASDRMLDRAAVMLAVVERQADTLPGAILAEMYADLASAQGIIGEFEVALAC